MIMKKSLILLFLCIIFLTSLVSATINLEITKEVVNDVVISEIPGPATFNLAVKNLGDSDNFEIYSLVNVEMSPKGTFYISGGETKNITVGVYPSDKVRKNTGIYSFVYKIRGQDSGIQDDILTIRIANLQDAVEIGTYNIELGSDFATLYIINKEKFNFGEITVDFNSAFFSFTKKFILGPLEKKEFKIPLDEEKTKGLIAGQYILTANMKPTDKEIQGIIKFVEKSSILTEETKSGIIIRTLKIEKVNDGNLPVIAQFDVTKNIISRLFTTFNVEPDKSERNGLLVYYTWYKELRPGESMTLIVRTSWIYFFILLILVIIVGVLVYISTISFLVVRKRVSYVRTKGGEFALKVRLHVKARKFVERISVIDKLPPVVKLYERFGAETPDKIDSKNRRMEWNIESLQPGEERVFSYVVYSKLGIVGKFELPSATAVFEREGKIHETESNKAFFVAEQAVRKEWKGE